LRCGSSLALRPARILPAHGPLIEEPDALIRRYIEHRHEREVQILAAVTAGHALPEAIVRTIYRVLPAGMQHLARETVLAHLLKLEAEGQVAREEGGPGEDGTRWHRINP